MRLWLKISNKALNNQYLTRFIFYLHYIFDSVKLNLMKNFDSKSVGADSNHKMEKQLVKTN